MRSGALSKNMHRQGTKPSGRAFVGELGGTSFDALDQSHHLRVGVKGQLQSGDDGMGQ